MKAIIINSYGNFDKVSAISTDVKVPTVGDDEIIIENKFVSISSIDTQVGLCITTSCCDALDSYYSIIRLQMDC